MIQSEDKNLELKLTRLNTLERISEGKHIIITNLMGYLKYLPSVTEKENNRKIQTRYFTYFWDRVSTWFSFRKGF